MLSKMVEEKNSYFPDEITEICKAYDEVRRFLPRTVEIASMSQEEFIEKLRDALRRYNETVPKNMQSKLTGLFFE